MHMMMQNFITRARLRYVAENDQTTGLRNRNAFEREQNDIPGRCRRTLSCVYMDINGLHELNNAMGHQAGDIMLREVADELKKQFGDELTYRMGGDEYVAFAPDLSEDRLHEKVRTFSLAIEQKDYHAALGWATCETASLRMKICSASRRPVCIRQRAPTIRIKISCPAAADLPLFPCFLPSFLL